MAGGVRFVALHLRCCYLGAAGGAVACVESSREVSQEQELWLDDASRRNFLMAEVKEDWQSVGEATSRQPRVVVRASRG